MTTMFIETLQSPYYEHVLGNVSSNFSDIVIIGEMVEYGLKSGRIAQNPSAVNNARKSGFNNNRKKEGEVQAASTVPHWRGYQNQFRPNYRPSQTYIASAVPNYQYNVPRPQIGYRPPMATHNADTIMHVLKIIIPIFHFQILQTLMIIWKMMNMMKTVNPLQSC